MSRSLIKKTLFFSMTGFCFILFVILFLNRSQSCTAIYDNDAKKEFTFKDFSKETACQKAVVICSYYNKDKNLCRIVSK